MGRCLFLLLCVASLPAAEFDDVRPILETYCYRCHNGELVTAGVNLQAFTSKSGVLAGRDVWTRVLRVLREQEMPPSEPLPSVDERRKLVDWVDSAVNHVDWDDVRYPGRVTIPRLSAVEYDNTIRDLSGLDLKLSQTFPGDGEGVSGFTNDRDGLFIPPLLLERYLAASETVVEELIAARRAESLLSERLEVEDLRITETNTPLKPWGYDLWKYQDTLYGYVRFPRHGPYRFDLRAWGQSENEGEVPGVTVRVGGEIVGQGPVLATADAPGVYRFEADVPRGNHQVSLHWYKVLTAETSDLNRRLSAEKKRLAAEAEARGEQPKGNNKPVLLSLDSLEISEADWRPPLVFIAEPGRDKSAVEAAREVLVQFASRAWRRPVQADEVAYLESLYRRAAERGEPFDEAVGLGLRAVLVSPHFLFRVEQGHGSRDVRRLDDYELASRLSYFLWISMPDEELSSLAAAGKLQQPGTLAAQVKRMIADPKSAAFTRSFAAQWLGYQGLGSTIKPDDVAFPEFTPALAADMLDEANTFFERLVVEDRSLLELIDADFAYLNERLATHYGIEGVVGQQLRRVALPDNRRGGILGMGAVLTATSLPVRTSPVVRGKWALEQLLGEELPPPPPDAGLLPEKSEATEAMTIREMYAMHRRSPSCASCHNRIDPIGFGLEKYDGIGRWRDAEANGSPIDATGILPDGRTFDGPAGLKQILLADKERFARTISERMLKFALGRDLAYYDEPTLREIVDAVVEADFRPSALIAAIVESYPFRYQAAESEPPPSE